MKRAFFINTLLLIIFIGVIVMIIYSFNEVGKQKDMIDELEKENNQLKNQVNYLEEYNETQTTIIEESDITVIEDVINLFVKSVYNVKEDNYDERKDNAETILTQSLFKEIFPEIDEYEIDYKYDITDITSYVNEGTDKANVYVTFHQSVTNINNNDIEESYVTIEVSLQKEGEGWLVNDFSQINSEQLK